MGQEVVECCSHYFRSTSHIHINCIELKTFAWGLNLKNWYNRKIVFGNAKNLSVFHEKCLLFSLLLVQSDKNTVCHANFCQDEKKFHISVI